MHWPVRMITDKGRSKLIDDCWYAAKHIDDAYSFFNHAMYYSRMLRRMGFRFTVGGYSGGCPFNSSGGLWWKWGN